MKNLEEFRRICKSDKKKTYLQFDRFSDLVDIVEENIGKSRIGFESEKQETGYNSFYRTFDLHEAIKLAKYGWNEGIEKLNQKVKIYSQDLAFKAQYDIAGGHVSVPRYLIGLPTNMVRKVPVKVEDKVITLVKFSSVWGSVSTDTMINNASKFIQMIQNLESQGYRCNVYIVFGSSSCDRKGIEQVVRVKIKNANERLNLAKMCYPLAHPSMFRRFIFKLREIDTKWSNSSYDYGSSFYGAGCEDGIEKIKPYLNKGEYFVPFTIENPAEFDFKKAVIDK